MTDTPNDQLTNPQSSAQVIPPDNSSYSGATIPPAAPAPAEGSRLAAQQMVPTASPVPSAATRTPTTPPAPKTKQEWMMHLLNKVAPPQNVVTTNPDGTQTVENRATPVSLAHLVLTSALAGAFGTKDTYRQGAYGPILDRQASNADAFNRGQQIGKDYSEAAQKQQDDLQARKLTTVAANIAAAHNYASLQQSQFAAEKEGAEAEAAQTKVMQNTADQNNATLGASADEYDQALTDKDAPKARLVQKATWDEVMNGPFKSKMTQQLMAQDGTRMVYDPATGRTKPVPTFSLYNPDVTLKLNKEAVDRAAKINPSFQGLYEITGGNVPFNLGRYVTVTHQINSVDHAEATLQSLADSKDDLAKTLGITGNVEGRLATVVKGNPSAMKSLLEFENGKAGGGNTADQLQRILLSDGGDAIFKALGTDRDKVQQFITDYNARIKAINKLAEQGGIGDKAPAPPQMIADIQSAAKLLDPDQQKVIMSGFNPNGLMTIGEAEQLKNKILQTQTENKNRLAAANKDAGNPADIARLARHLVDDPTNLMTMRDLGTRGTQREAILAKADELAEAEGKKFDIGVVNQRAKFLEQYEDPKGKAAINRQAINNIMQHAADVSDLNQLNRRSNVKVVNTPINALKDQFGDAVYTQYQTATGVLKDELGLYFAGGYAPTKDQQALWDKIQADTATPARTEAFAKEVIRLAARRADTFNQQFKTNMGYDDPNMITPQARSAAERLGLGDAVKQFGSGGQIGQNPRQAPRMVTVQIPGQPAGSISADKVTAFKAKYPNAVVGQ